MGESAAGVERGRIFGACGGSKPGLIGAGAEGSGWHVDTGFSGRPVASGRRRGGGVVAPTYRQAPPLGIGRSSDGMSCPLV